MIRGDQLIVVELKVGRNRLRPEQHEWMQAFRQVRGVVHEVWLPDDWPHIERTLA
jgi:hypothetical protein